VDLEEGNVVGRGLDAHHEAEPVVHPVGVLAHGAADAGAEVLAGLVVVGRVSLRRRKAAAWSALTL